MANSTVKNILDLVVQRTEDKWPHFKYMSFGLYYAWIFLCFDSTTLFPDSLTNIGEFRMELFVFSMSTVGVVSILMGVLHKSMHSLAENPKACLVFGLISSIATGILAFFSQQLIGTLGFPLLAMLMGVGTTMVLLRSVAVYSKISSREAFSHYCGSFVIAVLLSFAVEAFPTDISHAFVAVLPVLSVLLTVPEAASVDTEGEEDEPLLVIRTSSFPRGYWFRLVVAAAVFATVIGYARGHTIALSLTDPQTNLYCDTLSAFLVLGFAVLGYLAAGLLPERIDFSKCYYPIAAVSCFVIAITPFLSWQPFITIFGTASGIAYTAFTFASVALLTHVSHRTNMDSTAAFGWGFGITSLGIAGGWLVHYAVVATSEVSDNDSGLLVAATVMAALVAYVVIREGSLGQIINRVADAEDLLFVDEAQDEQDEPYDPTIPNSGGRWIRSCDAIAERYRLSKREREVLILLGKGRTIDAIAKELEVSFNTAKTHIRHVYTKTFVHSRKELEYLIEQDKNGANYLPKKDN